MDCAKKLIFGTMMLALAFCMGGCIHYDNIERERRHHNERQRHVEPPRRDSRDEPRKMAPQRVEARDNRAPVRDNRAPVRGQQPSQPRYR